MMLMMMLLLFRKSNYTASPQRVDEMPPQIPQCPNTAIQPPTPTPGMRKEPGGGAKERKEGRKAGRKKERKDE